MKLENASRAILYLGADIEGKHTVTDTDFSLFLEDEVTPRFAGFTVRPTLGYWKGKAEPSRELVIIGGQDERDFEGRVEAIALAYKVRFNQEAVMISFEPLNVAWNVVRS